jgi:DNA-binding response OmpR family regulator
MSTPNKLALVKIFKQKTALVIDDFPDMRGSIRRMLISYGIESVDTAPTGEEAILKCEENNYDIIIADYNLGDNKNGQQVLEELRHKNLLKNTSIYMMVTAETTKSMVFSALEFQPDDYLTKPFTQTVLEKRLTRMVLEKEALFLINNSMDRLDFDNAIALCKERIEQQDKYKFRCNKIMGNCLLKKERFSKAKELYQQVLGEREVEWAFIGLGKAQLALGDVEQAEATFANLVANGCMCMEVYDHLAEIKNRKGQAKEAQAILQEAIDISPNSFSRQQLMSQISEGNDDWEHAEMAHRKVIKLSQNSVHESPEHHFKLARCIGSDISQNGLQDSKRLKEAEDVLRLCKRKYKNDKNIALQSDAVLANVMACADKKEQSQKTLEEVESQAGSLEQRPATLQLEMARTYMATGQHEKAHDLLVQLADKYAEDEDVCEAIDQISDEPLTAQGKKKAIELNQQAKELFANKDYVKAVNLFGQALTHYPNNVGLNLNFMLALVRKMNADGGSHAEIDRCKAARDRIAHIDESNPLYERYQLLCQHLGKLEKKIAGDKA